MPTATHRDPAASSQRSRLRARLDGDRGAVAVEFALAVPLLILILVVLTQVFFWGMGYLAAHAAADHAAQTTRVVGGTAAAGQTDAEELLADLGGDFVGDPTVTVTRSATTTSVTFAGTAQGLPIPIVVTVQLPTERFTTP